MKIIKYSIAFILGLLFTVSCDVMDTEPFETYDDNTVWGTKESADAFVFEAYNHSVAMFAGKSAQLAAWTPNGVHSDIGGTDGFPLERFDRYAKFGFGYFGNLRRCNMIIEKSQKSDALNEQQKKELMGEGHFLRALIYFYQAQREGRFIPIQKVLTISDTVDFKKPLTDSPTESYKLIIEDINKAIDNLPEESLPGRATKYAALAFKSRIALQAYAYTKDNSYIDMAISAANTVIDSKKYSLDPNYGDMFKKAGAYSKEIILGYYRSDKNTKIVNFNEMIRVIPNVGNDDIRQSHGSPLLKNADGKTFECWGTYFPTQNLVDQYLVIDENDGKAKRWDETSQYLNNVSEQDVNTLTEGSFNSFDYKWKVPSKEEIGENEKGPKIIKYGKITNNTKINEIMYQNRDKRFYGTIVYDSCRWLKDELVTLCVEGNLWAGVRDGRADSWYTTCSNYYWKKGVYDVTTRGIWNEKTNYHFVISRLGEVYMNLTEAYLLKGDITKAVKAMNNTREIHGGLPASTASTEEDAWKDYIRERRVEMAYEGGDVYWSFLRWGKYGGFANNGKAPGSVIDALTEAPYKIQITKNRKRFFIGQITRHDLYNRKFTEKRYLLPIPQGEIDKRSAYGIIDKQNNGW